MREIIISDREEGQRMDKFLKKYMDQAPSGFFYKMMRKKNIVLNGKKAAGNEKLQNGDVLKLFLSDDTIDKFSGKIRIEPIQKRKTKLDVIYEDEHVLFVNKPVGLLSQKADSSDISLVEAITDYLLESGSLTQEDLRTFRPGVCKSLWSALLRRGIR
jgi:23S rRNA pseudouridine955/2504/2580 synthase